MQHDRHAYMVISLVTLFLSEYHRREKSMLVCGENAVYTVYCN